MDIAAAGYLILFFSILVALVLVGLLVLSYLAYSFLVVLSNTAVGNDEVLWPGEPMQDWFFNAWYLAWVVAVWAVPTSLLIGFLGPPRPLIAVYVGACLWLLFPIGLLSSLSAESRLAVLRPTILRQLFQYPGVTLGFYMSSGLVLALCGGLTYAAVFGIGLQGLDQPLIWMPLAAGFCAAGSLIYARLLGRLAWITSQARGEEEPVPMKESARADEPSPPRKQIKRRPKKTSRAVDPWAIPEKETPRKPAKPAPSRAALPEDPYGPAEGSYELVAENVPAVPEDLPARNPKHEEVAPYSVSPPAGKARGRLPGAEPPEVSRYEMELAVGRELPPLPALPFVTGVYSFPFYSRAVRPCFILTLGLFAMIGLLRLLMYVVPV
ncbi:MAG TPA: hypothetical protein VKU02_14155 [Gemmataceae bacterium]|nr:hypothetical protein [Gemmataceae bacterium]